MPSPFQDAAGAVCAAVDATFGELLRIVPLRPGRYAAATADPDRTVQERVGVFVEDRGERLRLNSSSVGHDLNETIVAVKITASFVNTALAGIDLRQGDRIVRVSQPGQPQYEITAVDPEGPARTIATLVKVPA